MEHDNNYLCISRKLMDTMSRSKPTGQNWKRCYTTRKFLAYFFCLIRIIVLRRETFSKRKFCNFRMFRTSSVEFDPRKKFFVKIYESLSHLNWTSKDNLMKTETYFQVYHWNWQTFYLAKVSLRENFSP